MSYFFSDPINGAALGPGTPAGFSFPAGGSSTVVANGPFPPDQWLEFSGQELDATLTTATLQKGITAWFAFQFLGYTAVGPIFQTWAYPVAGTQNIQTTILKVENDNTLSVYIGSSPNGFLWNSGTGTTPFYLQTGVWYFIQLDIQLGYSAGTSGFLSINNYDVAVDGNFLIQGIAGNSNFFTDQSFVNASPMNPGNQGMNFVSFSQPNGSGLVGISEVYVGGYQTTISYPTPGIHVFRRIPQIPLEYSYVPSDRSIRIPQAVAEVGKQPLSRNIRIPQLVIELPIMKAPAGGWILKEC